MLCSCARSWLRNPASAALRRQAPAALISPRSPPIHHPATSAAAAQTAISKVVVSDAFDKFTDHWSPKVAGKINNMHIKLVKLSGEFVSAGAVALTTITCLLQEAALIHAAQTMPVRHRCGTITT